MARRGGEGARRSRLLVVLRHEPHHLLRVHLLQRHQRLKHRGRLHQLQPDAVRCGRVGCRRPSFNRGSRELSASRVRLLRLFQPDFVITSTLRDCEMHSLLAAAGGCCLDFNSTFG